MPRGIYPRRKRIKAIAKAQQAKANLSVFISDEVVNMADEVARASRLLHDGMAMINEAQDIINCVPKRSA